MSPFLFCCTLFVSQSIQLEKQIVLFKNQTAYRGDLYNCHPLQVEFIYKKREESAGAESSRSFIWYDPYMLPCSFFISSSGIRYINQVILSSKVQVRNKYVTTLWREAILEAISICSSKSWLSAMICSLKHHAMASSSSAVY